MLNALDFLLIFFLVVGALWGLLRGAGKLLIGLFSLYVGLVVTLWLYRPLADFFREVVPRGGNGSPANPLRVAEELPWQLWKTESWAELYELLSDLDFLGSLIRGSVNEVYLYWSEIEKYSGFRLVNAYRFVIENPAERELVKRYCSQWKTIWRPYRFITELLIHYCYFREARALLETMMRDRNPGDRQPWDQACAACGL